MKSPILCYFVFIGRKPGVYDTWEETQAQVHKFSCAKQNPLGVGRNHSELFKHIKLHLSRLVAKKVRVEVPSQAHTEILRKLKSQLLDLDIENRKNALLFTEKMDEIKRQLKSIQLSNDS